MKEFLLASFIVAQAMAAAPALAEPPDTGGEAFLAGLSDIPLMPGLREDETASVLFDKPAGRILAVRLKGCLDARDVRHYYGATLPQLGWQLTEDGPASSSLVYMREGERLILEFADDGECLDLLFLLKPEPAARANK